MTQPSCPLSPEGPFLGILFFFEQPGYWKGCLIYKSLRSSASGHSCQPTLVLVLMSSVVWVLGSTGFVPVNPKSRSSSCRSSRATAEAVCPRTARSHLKAELSHGSLIFNLQGCLPTLVSYSSFPSAKPCQMTGGCE